MSGIMTETIWTKDRPNDPGFYWVIFRLDPEPEVIFLDPFGGVNVIGDDTYYYFEDILWWGDRLRRPYTPRETEF